MLFFTPCLGMCGVFGWSKVQAGRVAKEQQAAGERFVAAVEAGGLDAGPPPEHFTFRPLEDGGYVLYFAEPAFMVPTDFFYVWDRGQRRWQLREAGELP